MLTQAASAGVSDDVNAGFQEYLSSLRRKLGLRRKVLLLQAPQFLLDSLNLEVIRNRGYYAYPPTGLQWLAKSLAGQGLADIEYLDLNLEFLQQVVSGNVAVCGNWLDILGERLRRSQPAVVGVSCLSVYTDLFHTRHPLTMILEYLMRDERYLVIAGGPTATNEISSYLERQLCHFVIEGEGEAKLSYLLDAFFDAKAQPPPVSGVYFNFRGKVQATIGSAAALIPRGNLISTYRQIPLERYCRAGSLNPYSRMSGQDKVYGVFQLNRGCRFNCKFCGVRAFIGAGVRDYPEQEVIAELRYLVEERGVRHLEVLDDDFLANPQALQQVLKFMEELHRKYEISWSANNGLPAVSLTDELLMLMRDSGCIGFKIGIESGNRQMLRRIRKPGTVEEFLRIAELLRGYPQFFVGGNYIIGLFAEETFAQMLETFRLSCRLGFDWSSFTLFQFTSRQQALAENLKSEGAPGADFIPAKDSPGREVGEEAMPLGPEIFQLEPEAVPSRAQLKNIWLTFNLLGNYINNKNLKPEGDARKFVAWIEAVQVAYPQNPYMRLFSALGYVLLGCPERARERLSECEKIVASSVAWQRRFKKFAFSAVMENFPRDRKAVSKSLAVLQSAYKGCGGIFRSPPRLYQ